MASKDLIEDIINFLETERELYGDFSPAQSTLDNPETENERLKKSPQITDTPSVQESNINNYQAKEDSEDAMEKQEHLFEKKSEQKIYHKIESCETLEELRALCENANILRTDLENTNLVFGVGNPDADLMLIGEAPGANEDKQGEPFVGAAGKLLNKILAAVNFERDDVYITNILKHRPPNNRNPNPEERERSLPFLLRQIDIINPKLILCLGKVAAQTLLKNDNTLGSMRGKFHSFRGKYKLMATYHPAALLRHAQWKRPTWEDVQLLRKRYDELGCKP